MRRSIRHAPSSRTVMIAGAGIGGLTAALSVANAGFRVEIYEQAERLQETGAGIQLSPNSSRILIALGLRDALDSHLVAPQELRVINARSGRVLARAPLGAAVEKRYGAPYWVIHRGDLQTALVEAVLAHPDIRLHLGTRIDDFACYRDGITIAGLKAGQSTEQRGAALIAADGIWSRLRLRLGDRRPPRFANHTAWRALAPADEVAEDARAPAVNLWLGRHAHVVHYPVKGGRLINVVAIVRDQWTEPGWNAPGERTELLRRFPGATWSAPIRTLLAAPKRWQKWALYDRPPLAHWGEGPVTLLGDAAHPMLPYLAQGGAMAIEDAEVLGRCLAATPDDVPKALHRYERARRSRTARAQRAAQRNGIVYHLGGAAASLRTLAFITMRGDRLIRHYDWLYGWTPA